MLVPFVVTCLALCSIVSSTDSGWVSWCQSLYRVDPSEIGPLNYTSAISLCKSQGAYLVVPSSMAENDFIWDLYQEYVPAAAVWIGCLRDKTGEWGCAEDGGAGIDTPFRNWSPSHESENFLPSRSCSVITGPGFADADGQWKAKPCWETKRVICKKPLDQPAALNNLCNTVAGYGQSCLAARLLYVVKSKHLSKVAIHSWSQYSITPDCDPCTKIKGYSLLSSDLRVDGMKTESWNIAVHYTNNKQNGSVTGPP